MQTEITAEEAFETVKQRFPKTKMEEQRQKINEQIEEIKQQIGDVKAEIMRDYTGAKREQFKDFNKAWEELEPELKRIGESFHDKHFAALSHLKGEIMKQRSGLKWCDACSDFGNYKKWFEKNARKH